MESQRRDVFLQGKRNTAISKHAPLPLARKKSTVKSKDLQFQGRYDFIF